MAGFLNLGIRGDGMLKAGNPGILKLKLGSGGMSGNPGNPGQSGISGMVGMSNSNAWSTMSYRADIDGMTKVGNAGIGIISISATADILLMITSITKPMSFFTNSLAICTAAIDGMSRCGVKGTGIIPAKLIPCANASRTRCINPAASILNKSRNDIPRTGIDGNGKLSIDASLPKIILSIPIIALVCSSCISIVMSRNGCSIPGNIGLGKLGIAGRLGSVKAGIGGMPGRRGNFRLKARFNLPNIPDMDRLGKSGRSGRLGKDGKSMLVIALIAAYKTASDNPAAAEAIVIDIPAVSAASFKAAINSDKGICGSGGWPGHSGSPSKLGSDTWNTF